MNSRIIIPNADQTGARVEINERPGASAHGFAGQLARMGQFGLRHGLVVVIGWIGALKFTAYESDGISLFVANSPFMTWVYGVMSQRQFGALLGFVELAIAALIAAEPWSPRAAVVGAAAAVGMFLTTLSFLVTTPGVFEAGAGGFPALSVLPGQFLLKDVALMGIAIWLLADALKKWGFADKGLNSGAC